MISRALLIAVAAMAGADAFAPGPALPSRLGLRASSSLRMNMRSDKIWTPLSARGNQPIRMMPEPPKPDQSPSKPSIPMPMVLRPFALDLSLMLSTFLLLSKGGGCSESSVIFFRWF